MFYMFAASVALDVLLHCTSLLWRWRNGVAIVSLILTGVSSVAIGIWRPNTVSVFFALVGLYRVFNDVRLLKQRMHAGYLRRATRTTALSLIATQLLATAIWWAWYQTPADRRMIWLGVVIAQICGALVLLLSTIRRLRHTQPLTSVTHYSDAQLPSISVAIPARNETEDLQQCLESIIASDYPKLEILVLDDCSQNKRTPEIIRSFAHDGVRFLQGEEPRPTWLAKNQAYDYLTREANGEIIIFCGVDIRMQSQTIREIVSLMLDKHKDMVSILPLRRSEARTQSSVVQAMRYWWELAPPRRLFRRPAVLGSCWAINRKALSQTGGFAAVTRAIVPESYFAKAMIHNDRYTFMRSNQQLGVESVKQYSDQIDTAIRTRYPQLHRRPEQVMLVTLAEIVLLLLPFGMAIGGWWLPISGLTHVLVTLASVLLIATYELVTVSTRINHWAYGLIGLPIMILSDVVLLHQSMWRYEFSTVEWKGRNVCVPVMHTVPHLPKI